MADFETSSITVESFIHGYHVYKDVADWDPQLQEERVLKHVPNNKRISMRWRWSDLWSHWIFWKVNNHLEAPEQAKELDRHSIPTPWMNRRMKYSHPFANGGICEQVSKAAHKQRKVGRDRKASRPQGWLWIGSTVHLHIFWGQKKCQYLGWSRNLKVSAMKFCNYFIF